MKNIKELYHFITNSIRQDICFIFDIKNGIYFKIEGKNVVKQISKTYKEPYIIILYTKVYIVNADKGIPLSHRELIYNTIKKELAKEDE